MCIRPYRLRDVLLLLCALLGSIPLAFSSEPQWVEVRSPHFSVVTDAGEKRGREAAMRFEQMRAVFGALMTKANVNLAVPLQIVAFRSTKEMRQFTPLWNGKPVQDSGLFEGNSDRTFILLDMSTEDPWKVVFHEYGHQLLNGNVKGRLDPWFEEGFAEYFSSIEVDSKEARVGKIPDEPYLILQRNGMMKVADLLRVQQNSSTYNESGDHRTVFYAESSMLVHYLFDNQLLPKLQMYFDLAVTRKMPVQDAIQQAFGMNTAQFDKALATYARLGESRYYRIPNPPNIVSANYTVTPLAANDINAILADAHLHSPDYLEKSVAEFQQILKSDSNHAAACRGLGFAYLEKHDFVQAREYFQRAAQSDSKDPRVHYYAAMLMSRQSNFTDSSELPAMTKELETAIALDPSFADSYMLLAFAQSASGDPGKGVATMQHAVALSPQNENYLYDLAQMYLTNRQPDQGIAVLESLQGSADPRFADQVRDTLVRAREFKAALEQGANFNSGVRTAVLDRRAAPEPDSRQQSLPQELARDSGPPKFLKGKLVSVDCSAAPSAILTVVSGPKTWKMKVADSAHLILIGADKFSCAWTNQKIAVNYREAGTGEGSVLSVEIQ